MKSKWMVLPVVLLAVFGLLFLGCDDGSKSSSSTPSVTWTPTDLTVDDNPDSTTDTDRVVWLIDAEDIAAIQEAYAANTGVKLRLTFTAEENLSDHGIGAIGVLDGETLGLEAPKYTGTGSFDIEIWVHWLAQVIGADETEDPSYAIIAWANKNCELTGFQLLIPSAQVTPPAMPTAPQKPEQVPIADYTWVQDITVEFGSSSDEAIGKGWINDDLSVLEAAKAGSKLQLYIIEKDPPNQSGWGVGTIGKVSGGLAINTNGQPLFTVAFNVDDLLENIDGSNAGIFINVYNGVSCALVELWEPDGDVVLPLSLDLSGLADLTENSDWEFAEGGLINKVAAFANQYDNMIIKLEFPDGFKLSDYTYFDVNAQFFASDGTTEIDNNNYRWSLGGLKFLSDAEDSDSVMDNCNYDNLSCDGTEPNNGTMKRDVSRFGGELPDGMLVQKNQSAADATANGTFVFIKITSIKFYN